MKRIAAIASASLFIFCSSAVAGPTLDRVNERKEMVVATNVGWPPQVSSMKTTSLSALTLMSPRKSATGWA